MCVTSLALCCAYIRIHTLYTPTCFENGFLAGLLLLYEQSGAFVVGTPTCLRFTSGEEMHAKQWNR